MLEFHRRAMLGWRSGAGGRLARRLCPGAAAQGIEAKPFTLPPPIGRPERLVRLAGARALMQRHGIGAILVESGPSLDYFTGVQWWRSERLTGAVIPASGDPIIVTPFFEKPSIEEILGIPAEIRTWQEDEEPLKLVADFLTEKRRRERARSALRKPTASSSSTAFNSSFRTRESSAPTRSSAPAGCIKSPAEIALMQAAADITIAAFRTIHPQIREGMTPSDIGKLFAAAITARGGTSPWSLVLLGEASAYPHGIGQAAARQTRRGRAARLRMRGPWLSVRHFAHLRIRRRRDAGAAQGVDADAARPGHRLRRGQVGAPAGRSTMPSAGPTKAGATARATNCPARRTAPATASAWRAMSRSTWSMARRPRSRPACAFPTSPASTFPASSESGSRIAST